MNLSIYTRTHSDSQLYPLAASLWPEGIARHPLEFNGFEGAADFLWEVINTAEGYALICDEDCFIYDWSRIEKMLTYLETGSKAVLAIPDGGVTEHRAGFDWFQLNPFFMLLDAPVIRRRIETSGLKRWQIDKMGYRPDLDQYRPFWILEEFGTVVKSTAEPFHGLSVFLVASGLVDFIKVEQHKDGISTDTGFALHSWYARDFEAQEERILAIYNEARR
jgi:hypothetical protein